MDISQFRKNGKIVIPKGLKSAANAYLMARANAEAMRQRVDKIQREILAEHPLKIDPQWKEGERSIDLDEITDPKDTYLATDSDMTGYFSECDYRERRAGVKPADMPTSHCPALVAEHLQTQTQWLIMDVAAETLGMDFDGKELNNRLLCKGLEEYHRFIDLVVGLVVNSPGYKNPLTGEVLA